ncbi:MAG: ATP synthase F1 subunit epsilon [Patescibacteria group bacterium]|nr:ATP synthase F1 subunit epsilon [Patescibacteria group bacterium]
MSKTSFEFKIVTPERVVMSEVVKQVTISTVAGEITVLPHHLSLVSLLKPGEVRAVLHDSEVTVSMAVSGGFIEVTHDRVLILADTAERAEEIDEQQAVAAHQRAQQLMTESKNRDDVDYTALAGKIEKELARLKVARKRRPGIQPHIES